jgi:hypothetical protein
VAGEEVAGKGEEVPAAGVVEVDRGDAAAGFVGGTNGLL